MGQATETIMGRKIIKNKNKNKKWNTVCSPKESRLYNVWRFVCDFSGLLFTTCSGFREKGENWAKKHHLYVVRILTVKAHKKPYARQWWRRNRKLKPQPILHVSYCGGRPLYSSAQQH